MAFTHIVPSGIAAMAFGGCALNVAGSGNSCTLPDESIMPTAANWGLANHTEPLAPATIAPGDPSARGGVNVRQVSPTGLNCTTVVPIVNHTLPAVSTAMH